jgi:hypothetical protein
MQLTIGSRNRDRLSTLVVLFFVFLSVLSMAGTPDAHASGGLTFRSDATYTVHAEDGYVAVNNHITLTNVKPNTRSGYRITQYYYDRFQIVVPDEAEEIVATSGGRELRLELTEEDGVRLAEIRLRSRLFYKRTQTIDLDFKLLGDSPRSYSVMRVNPAYVSFFAWAWGDDSKSSVTVLAPEGFQLEFMGDGILFPASTEEPGMQAWTHTEIEKPYEWFSGISGSRNEALAKTEFTVGPAQIQMLSWPGDDGWTDTVESTLKDGLPVLVDVIGLDWPVEDDLIIRESVAPNRFGYAGWYFTELDEIEMGEELDRIVVLHEVAHAWFNDELFEERWIVEGLASSVAAHVARSEFNENELPRLIRSNAADAVQLNNWRDRGNSDEREEFAYNASWWIMYKIIDEVGIEKFAEVIVAADRDAIAYRGAGYLETVDPEDDWRRFLDLVQEVAGSESAPELFRKYVVRTPEIERMDERDEARSRLEELESAASGWVTPIVVRRPMSEWDFDEALSAMDGASAVLTLRDQLLEKAADAELEISDVMRTHYEAADGTFEYIMAYGEARMAAIDVIEAAEAELAVEPDLMTQVGLWRNDDPAELAVAARNAYNDDHTLRAEALANQAVADLAAARELGVERTRNVAIAAGALLVLLLGLVIWWIRRRRRRKRLRIARQGVYEAISAAVVAAGDGGQLPESGDGTAFPEADGSAAVSDVGDGPVLPDVEDGLALPDAAGATALPDQGEYLSSS